MAANACTCRDLIGVCVCLNVRARSLCSVKSSSRDCERSHARLTSSSSEDMPTTLSVRTGLSPPPPESVSLRSGTKTGSMRDRFGALCRTARSCEGVRFLTCASSSLSLSCAGPLAAARKRCKLDLRCASRWAGWRCERGAASVCAHRHAPSGTVRPHSRQRNGRTAAMAVRKSEDTRTDTTQRCGAWCASAPQARPQSAPTLNLRARLSASAASVSSHLIPCTAPASDVRHRPTSAAGRRRVRASSAGHQCCPGAPWSRCSCSECGRCSPLTSR